MILLSDFSSFLEIVAGIYTSMCLNDVLKGIWDTKYYANLKSTLEQFKIAEHEKVINQIIENNKKVADQIKHFMQRRASLMLVIDIILLMLCGLETRFSEDGSYSQYLQYVQFYMVVISVLAFVSLLFNRYLFTSNRKAAVATIVILLVSLLLLVLNIGFDFFWLSDSYLYSIIFILSAPILWQLFSCWAYSNAYVGYIKKKVGKVRSQYEAVKRGIEHKDTSLVPQEYKQLFTERNIVQSGATLSQCLSDYLDILEERLEEDSKPSSAIKIFLSWFKFKLTIFIDYILILLQKKEKIKREQVNIDTDYKKIVKNIDPAKLDYSKQLSEYREEKKEYRKMHKGFPPSMKIFCEKHKYNYEEMISWVRYINKNNKIAKGKDENI